MAVYARKPDEETKFSQKAIPGNGQNHIVVPLFIEVAMAVCQCTALPRELAALVADYAEVLPVLLGFSSGVLALADGTTGELLHVGAHDVSKSDAEAEAPAVDQPLCMLHLRSGWMEQQHEDSTYYWRANVSQWEHPGYTARAHKERVSHVALGETANGRGVALSLGTRTRTSKHGYLVTCGYEGVLWDLTTLLPISTVTGDSAAAGAACTRGSDGVAGDLAVVSTHCGMLDVFHLCPVVDGPAGRISLTSAWLYQPALSTDGNWAAAGSGKVHALHLAELSRLQATTALVGFHHNSVLSCAFPLTGAPANQPVSGDANASVCVWDTRTTAPVVHWFLPEARRTGTMFATTRVGYVPGQPHAVWSTHRDGQCCVWDMRKGGNSGSTDTFNVEPKVLPVSRWTIPRMQRGGLDVACSIVPPHAPLHNNNNSSGHWLLGAKYDKRWVMCEMMWTSEHSTDVMEVRHAQEASWLVSKSIEREQMLADLQLTTGVAAFVGRTKK